MKVLAITLQSSEGKELRVFRTVSRCILVTNANSVQVDAIQLGVEGDEHNQAFVNDLARRLDPTGTTADVTKLADAILLLTKDTL
jgi:hypothetical protein